MRPYQYTLAIILPLFSAFSAIAQTHLDIRQPSLAINFTKGSVKKITEEYNYEMSDKKYREIKAYDEAGNLNYRKKFNYKDELTYSATNTFNEAGCHVRQVIDDVKDEKIFDYEIVLSPDTHQIAYKCQITGEIEVLTYNTDGFLMNATIKKPGKKMLPQSKHKRRPDNRSETYTRYDEDGRVKYISYYQRDDRGRLKKAVVSYKREKRKDTTSYEYLSEDHYGNWTQRLVKITTVKDGKEKQFDKFSERKIEYYGQ